MSPPVRSSDRDTIQPFLETEYPLSAFLSRGICRRYLLGTLCILLAIAALRLLQCIQWMKRCSAEGEKPDQKV